ncbi:hypothetical protein KGM_215488 [Danaus plexippus plexippus]|uniref:Uncharacterized protein n=1 Tax=Danaus plexippus plexippus TaxID=278856 RepID=A0A212EJM8_DANPL|nr:hypothetical protein KGM_215488 [Danaus plexippus plexippus]
MTRHSIERAIVITMKFTLDIILRVELKYNEELPYTKQCSGEQRSLFMALLNIRGEWYLYIWIIYRKIYSAFIWLFGNHCRVDKGRALISAGVARQSIGGLHRVRTRRRRQQHRKHVVALVRRPSVRRIVMAPGATAHAMMEDKEKILSNENLENSQLDNLNTIFLMFNNPYKRRKSLFMALLNIRGEWYLYIWIIYRKIYSAFIWLFGNHCRVDKGRALISAGVARQSIGGLHRVRTRRRRQQHRKHVVALVRRPSVRRIVMAPGATAHAMMEDKEKILSNGNKIGNCQSC